MKRQVRELTERGMTAMTRTALVPLRIASQKEADYELLKTYCVYDKQGNVYPDREGRNGKHEVWLCVNQDYWIDEFVEGLSGQIDEGFAATHIDLAKPAICYCNVCQEKWRAYSRQRLGTSLTVEEANQTKNAVVAATYKTFRYDSVIRFLRKVHRRIDPIKPGYGIDTTNHMHDRSFHFWVHGRDVFDIACIELTTVHSGWFPPLGESLSSYRLALACLGANHTVWGLDKMLIPSEAGVDPGITMEDASTADQWVAANPGERWQRLNPSADRQRLYLAQGLAEGVMVNPQSLADHHAESWGTRPIAYHDIIGAYYNFHRKHANLLRRAQSGARVAVLFSVADDVFAHPSPKYAFYGLCETLLKAHIPYDVRVLEHPREITASQYKVLLIPSGVCLSDAAIDMLAAAVKAGTTVLRFSPLGERTETFRPRNEPLPPALGLVQKLDLNLEDLLFPFNQAKIPAAAEKLASHILNAAGEPVRIVHSSAETLATTYLKTDNGILLHIFNFNVATFPNLPEREQLQKETAVPAQDVEIHLELPPDSLVREVNALSPDHTRLTISFRQEGERVSFLIPRVDIWEVVSIDFKPSKEANRTGF